ncbi:MAG: hypothetical protein LC749_05315 [Actinobacteria bacterium]|nr:hypothetical protein [Actinomycetota bacterium]
MTGVQFQIVKGNYADPNAGRILFVIMRDSGWRPGTLNPPRLPATSRSCVLPRWEAVLLAKIDHIRLQAWVTELGTRHHPPWSPKSTALASGMLRSAVRNRLPVINPAERIRLPKRRKPDTADRVISHDE